MRVRKVCIMIDKKPTDNEIKKALECCISKKVMCDKCPLSDKCQNNPFWDVKASYALDFINRQKAEIERLETVLSEKLFCITQLKGENFALTNERDAYKNLLKNAKTEAVKEFARKLKCGVPQETGVIRCKDVDNLVKEMAGD